MNYNTNQRQLTVDTADTCMCQPCQGNYEYVYETALAAKRTRTMDCVRPRGSLPSPRPRASVDDPLRLLSDRVVNFKAGPNDKLIQVLSCLSTSLSLVF